jgi:hypothetical protein
MGEDKDTILSYEPVASALPPDDPRRAKAARFWFILSISLAAALAGVQGVALSNAGFGVFPCCGMGGAFCGAILAFAAWRLAAWQILCVAAAYSLIAPFISLVTIYNSGSQRNDFVEFALFAFWVLATGSFLSCLFGLFGMSELLRRVHIRLSRGKTRSNDLSSSGGN